MRELFRVIKFTLLLWIITAIIYPSSILLIAQVFPVQAKGSLIKGPNDQIIGSTLIGQRFNQDNYFWGRPSAINYSESEGKYEETGRSGGSNLAPSNPNLVRDIVTRIEQLKASNITPQADLVYTSGSGLDPHISIPSAQAQIQRVAIARNLNIQQIEELVNKNIDRRFLGIFGEPGINVLKLNLALDQLSSNKS